MTRSNVKLTKFTYFLRHIKHIIYIMSIFSYVRLELWGKKKFTWYKDNKTIENIGVGVE
jgi:uncharacterized membrane protein